MGEMKKQTSFLDNTRWMFENNLQLHADNYSPNPIWANDIIPNYKLKL